MKERSLSQILCLILITVSAIPAAFAESDNPLIKADRNAFEFIREDLQNSTLKTVMRGVTRLGDGRFIISMFLLLSIFGDEKKFETAKLGASAFGATGVSIYVIKELTDRMRPLGFGDDSFPSGHSGFAFATARIISHQYPKLTIPSYLIATSIGFSRIYLGRHFPSDVLVGAFIGSLAAEGVIRYKEAILRLEF